MATNGVLDFQSTNKLIFRGTSANVVIDTQNLSLGVGHQGEGAIPYKLHVTGDANGSTTFGPVAGLGFEDSGVSFCGIKVGEKGDSPYSRTALSVEDNGNTILHVDGQNQRVGIGRTDPNSLLDVNGSTRSGYDTDTVSYFGRSAVGYTGHSDWAGFAHIDANTTSNYAIVQNSAGRTILNCKSTERISFSSGDTEKITMLGNGNLGVGAGSPVTKLDVQGASGGSPPSSGGEGTSNGLMRIRDNYNVTLDIGTKGSLPWNAWIQVADATGMGTEYPLSLQPNGGDVLIGTMGVGTQVLDGRALLHFKGNIKNGIAWEPESTQSNSRAWRLTNDDYGPWGNLSFNVSTNNSSAAGNNTVLSMTKDKFVGIQRQTPYCPLHVSGYGGTSSGATWHSGFIHGYTALNRWAGDHGNVGIFADDDIMTHGYVLSIGGSFTASDRRIKTDIVDIDDGMALQTLRQLQPKQYKYIDTYKNTSDPVWGFIAQEVRETLPHSTNIRTECIPDITEVATVSETNVLTFTNFDTSNLEPGTNIRVHDKNDVELKIKVAKIIDAHSIRVEEDVSEWTCSFNEDGTIGEGDSLYVYGQEIDDFVFIKKDAIWTVATAALQEVDRQLQAEKARNDALEARIAALENNISS